MCKAFWKDSFSSGVHLSESGNKKQQVNGSLQPLEVDPIGLKKEIGTIHHSAVYMFAPSESNEGKSERCPGKNAGETGQAEGLDAAAFPTPREHQTLCCFSLLKC